MIALAELYESDLSAFAQGIEPQKRKKHINLFAGFGLVFFNFVLGFWLIITTALILLALYAIILALFLAPFIMIFAVATHNPHITFGNANGATGFDWWYWLVAIIACSLMVLVSPLIWRFTKLLYFWLIKSSNLISNRFIIKKRAHLSTFFIFLLKSKRLIITS